GRSITSTRLTTRARRRTDRFTELRFGYVTVRLVTGLRYGTGFYKNPYVPVVTFLSWLFHSESARGFVDLLLVKQRSAQVVEIGLPCCLPTLEQIQMLSPVDHFARRSRPSRCALMVGRPRRDRYDDHRQCKNRREPKSETIWCACAICSPSWQQTEISGLCRASRKAHGEHRAFALLARHGHVTAHHARELAGDGEAETGAAEAPRGRGIGLAELLEQLRLLLRRHANAGIDHR